MSYVTWNVNGYNENESVFLKLNPIKMAEKVTFSHHDTFYLNAFVMQKV